MTWSQMTERERRVAQTEMAIHDTMVNLNHLLTLSPEDLIDYLDEIDEMVATVSDLVQVGMKAVGIKMERDGG